MSKDRIDNNHKLNVKKMSLKIRCVTVDDEPLALEKMNAFVERVPYLELVGSFDNGFGAMNFLRQEKVDLMFLDIQMDELTGIQLLEVLTQRPRIILTTAYDQYAIKGYELDVSDYLLKPVSFQRFLMAVEKVYNSLNKDMNEKQEESKERTEITDKDSYILVRSEYRLQKVFLDNIFYIEGMKDYSRIFTTENRIMTLQNLKKIEETLPTPPFFRVHKSYIISSKRVSSIGKNDIFINGQQIPIGGLYKKTFLDYIKKQRLIG